MGAGVFRGDRNIPSPYWDYGAGGAVAVVHEDDFLGIGGRLSGRRRVGKVQLGKIAGIAE